MTTPDLPLFLNIGCGKNHLREPGWVNIDLSPDVGADLIFDLRTIEQGHELPFHESTVSRILLSHVLEHLQYPLPILEEFHRVSKPGGELIIRVPYGSSDIAFEDPTHYRQYFLNSFWYFGQPAYAAADYGYKGDWQVEERVLVFASHVDRNMLPDNPAEVMQLVNTHRNLIEEFICVLTAVKPARLPGQPSFPQGSIRFAFPEDIKGAAHG